MSWELDDLKALARELGPVVESMVQNELGKLSGQPAETAPAAAPAAEPSKGETSPENSLDAAPEYYVHLANGDVIKSKDSGSTHLTVDGMQVAVIGRYPVGE